MSDWTSIKAALIRICEEHILDRISNSEEALQRVIESRDNESKSSVGDKYETGRSIMQSEQSRIEAQIEAAQNTLRELKSIPSTVSEKSPLGKVVTTDKAMYFVSSGVGKVNLKNAVYYCISPKSPIALILQGKETGDTFDWGSQTHTIQSIQ